MNKKVIKVVTLIEAPLSINLPLTEYNVIAEDAEYYTIDLEDKFLTGHPFMKLLKSRFKENLAL